MTVKNAAFNKSNKATRTKILSFFFSSDSLFKKNAKSNGNPIAMIKKYAQCHIPGVPKSFMKKAKKIANASGATHRYQSLDCLYPLRDSVKFFKK